MDPEYKDLKSRAHNDILTQQGHTYSNKVLLLNNASPNGPSIPIHECMKANPIQSITPPDITSPYGLKEAQHSLQVFFQLFSPFFFL